MLRISHKSPHSPSQEGHPAMGYPVKLQKVQRPTNRSYYLNLPAPLAEAIEAQKGEVFEWTIEDKNTLVLRRIDKQNLRRFKH